MSDKLTSKYGKWKITVEFDNPDSIIIRKFRDGSLVGKEKIWATIYPSEEDIEQEE